MLGPFEVLKRPLTLKPPDGAPPAAPPAGTSSETAGLVAWWKLDETDGSTAADASEHHLNGRVQGKPGWAPRQGRLAGALELDGTHSFVDCGGAEEVDFREAMTVSFWLKTRQAEKLTSTLVAKGNNTWQFKVLGEKHNLRYALAGPVATGTNRPSAPSLTSQRVVDDGQWHHVVGQYDGRRASLYLDGSLEDSLAAAGPVAVNTEPVMLGRNSMGPNRSFNGWLDDVRLYRRVLSGPEIQALYRGGTNTSPAAK